MKRSHDVDFDALFDSLNTGASTPEDDDASSELDEDWDEEDDD
jgi:hypothetical protein